MLDIFALFSGYILVDPGIYLQLDREGAKASSCAASTARI